MYVCMYARYWINTQYMRRKSEQIIPKGRAIFNLRLHILGIGLTVTTYEEEMV